MTRVLVGTSGWSYASWRGPFFPTGLPAKRQLEYYASQFETVELNGVFYRTPTPEAVRRWDDETGRHFVFSWKASKFISHWGGVKVTEARRRAARPPSRERRSMPRERATQPRQQSASACRLAS
jgi:uncharacterized protein YecE (DUF72 family)